MFNVFVKMVIPGRPHCVLGTTYIPDEKLIINDLGPYISHVFV